MRISSKMVCLTLGAFLVSVGGLASAKLPALTPEQEKAAEEKKAKAAAQAQKEKQELAASMEKVANRWRERAGQQGWQVYPPTPVAGGPGAGAPQAQPGAPAQQGAVPQMPIRSEKHGTAPPSRDVKDPTKKGL